MLKKILYLIPLSLLLMVGCSEPTPSLDGVKISGKVTYDYVPVDLSYGGIAKLDYAKVKKVASKNVVVKALDGGGKTLATTKTDKNGHYSFVVAKNVNVKVRVYARIYKEDSWDVSVVDNTNMKALYVIEGKYHNSGEKHNIRNLHASSGWVGTDYQNPRVAAPFAILDSINKVMNKVRQADNDAKFPQLTVNWSVNNIAAGGDLESGQIVTSHYDGEQGLWILGDANSDTDEYDDHIIIHEWGHYFEDQFSRTDSIGGPHSTGEELDIRLAFGEGWGNALSGIATDNPIYFDTSGMSQSYGWYMDLESGAQKNPGWYAEGSVQRILYDLYDADTDESYDRVHLGFKPIYEAMIGKERNTKAFTSIFSFIHAIKSENSGKADKIDRLVAYEQIHIISDSYGTDRKNTANSQYTTPVYRDLRVGGVMNVCNRNNFGVYNKLGNRSYIKIHIATAGNYRVDAHPSNGQITANTDPDILIYSTKYPHENIGISSEEGSSSDRLSIYLEQGDYLLDVYDASFDNSCYTISLNRVANSYKAKEGVMAKPTVKRPLPKRQYAY
ncbi:MAG TPA: hypothetical protein EYG67_01965 [Campylobacterales bacterium]|nr:hypothetical protein [Campylobacterales bacterium]HIP41440.1 hypothetical protein [Campylobacterales bacterium]